MPPAAAKRSGMSLPMPLAAPVMMATFPSKRDIALSFGLNSGFRQVI